MKEYELLEVLAALTTTYRIKPEAEAAYKMALADEDYGLVGEAVKRWIKAEIWPPRPAELIGMANDIRDDQVRDGIRSLPMPAHVDTADDYERLLRIEKLAAEMGITLHASHEHRLREAHDWKTARERGIA